MRKRFYVYRDNPRPLGRTCVVYWWYTDPRYHRGEWLSSAMTATFGTPQAARAAVAAMTDVAKHLGAKVYYVTSGRDVYDENWKEVPDRIAKTEICDECAPAA